MAGYFWCSGVQRMCFWMASWNQCVAVFSVWQVGWNQCTMIYSGCVWLENIGMAKWCVLEWLADYGEFVQSLMVCALPLSLCNGVLPVIPYFLYSYIQTFTHMRPIACSFQVAE